MQSGRLKSLLAFVLILGVCSLQAEDRSYNFGKTPTDEELREWGPLVGPSGQELPLGSGTAIEGEKVYAQKCAYCHGPTGAEPFMHFMRKKPYTPEMYCCFPAPLVGGEESFTTLIPVKSVGAYWATATTLWDYINRGMPPDEYFRSVRGYEFAASINAMGPLTADEVYALTAFILSQSNIIKKTDVMNATTLPKVKMPGRKLFIPENPGEWYPKRQVDPHISPNSRSITTEK